MASKSGAPGTDASYLLLTLEYVDDMVEKRGPYREEHLAGARKGFDEGKIVMAGALMDPVDAGVFVFKNCEREEVEAFVEADAYYKAGLIPGVLDSTVDGGGRELARRALGCDEKNK